MVVITEVLATGIDWVLDREACCWSSFGYQVGMLSTDLNRVEDRNAGQWHQLVSDRDVGHWHQIGRGCKY